MTPDETFDTMELDMAAGVDAGEGGAHQAADKRKMPGCEEIGKILRRITKYGSPSTQSSSRESMRLLSKKG